MNERIINLFENKNNGIFSIINSESYVKFGEDAKISHNIHTLGTDPELIPSKGVLRGGHPQMHFVVKHGVKNVVYYTEGFRLKNRNDYIRDIVKFTES